MNYHNITKCDMLNGDGIRVVLWVSGCKCHCPECQNPETWDLNSGILFDNEAKNELFEALDNDYIKGLTLSGGHPLESENLSTMCEICKEFKNKFPTKDIWLYTGYNWEDILNWEIIKYIDVLVDGRYIKDQRNVDLKWRGSSNQRVINAQESLKQNKVVLYCD